MQSVLYLAVHSCLSVSRCDEWHVKCLDKKAQVFILFLCLLWAVSALYKLLVLLVLYVYYLHVEYLSDFVSKMPCIQSC